MSFSDEDFPCPGPKFCEGPMKHKKHSGRHWEPLWLVLKGHTIHCYKSTSKVHENCFGTLTVDPQTVFHILKHDKKKGYKFELETAKHVNKFATETMSQREQWRAYIEGLSSGTVPKNIDLLPHDVDRIQNEIDEYLDRQNIKRISTEDSGIGGSTDGSSLNEHERLTEVERECPEQVYSWYFGECTRDKAETILTNGYKYGNTLMRKKRPSESRHRRQYAISKCTWINRLPVYEHFKVNETDGGGYRLEVLGVHEEFKALTDVMDYFVQKKGGLEHCTPMKTNDLRKIGCDDPNYATHITEGDVDASSIGKLPKRHYYRRKTEPALHIDTTLLEVSSSPRYSERPLPPLPCEKQENEVKPFLKSNSEGKLKGLRPEKSGSAEVKNVSAVDKDSVPTILADLYRGSDYVVPCYVNTELDEVFTKPQGEGKARRIPELPKRHKQRRRTEPAVCINTEQLEGLNTLFKQQLSSVLSGQQCDKTRRNSDESNMNARLDQTEYHIYAEPDI